MNFGLRQNALANGFADTRADKLMETMRCFIFKCYLLEIIMQWMEFYVLSSICSLKRVMSSQTEN
jgi:hypothetical protein